MHKIWRAPNFWWRDTFFTNNNTRFCFTNNNTSFVKAHNHTQQHPMPKYKLSVALRNELRRLAAVKCYAGVYSKEYTQIKEQKVYMFNTLHGNQAKGILSTNDLLAIGYWTMRFEDLYVDQRLKYEFSRSKPHMVMCQHIIELTLHRTK